MYYAVTLDEKNHRFEVHFENEVAWLEYRFYKNDMALMHTIVPEPISDHGIASALSRYALEYAKANHLKVIVYCPFVRHFINEHPEYETLIDKIA